MARYADIDKFAQNLKTNEYGETTVTQIGIALDKARADVVPKSEVEWVYYNLQAVLEERAETKQEIAREIFEEIEDVLNNIGYFDEFDFEALKKKYTEGNNG